MSELELCTSDSDLISQRRWVIIAKDHDVTNYFSVKSFDTIHEEDEEMEEYDENTLEVEMESSYLKEEVLPEM